MGLVKFCTERSAPVGNTTQRNRTIARTCFVLELHKQKPASVLGPTKPKSVKQQRFLWWEAGTDPGQELVTSFILLAGTPQGLTADCHSLPPAARERTEELQGQLQVHCLNASSKLGERQG